MKIPDFPENEETRLQNLRSLGVLDTPAEERFDRLTRLARRMFNVPIALVSLVDANRQWFKSCMGLDTLETSREISFCGHSILGDDIFMIPDAVEDERFFDNPLVTDEPKIRFYAGCPLRFLDGSKMGTLCIIDTNPRILSDEDQQALRDLAKLAENELLAVHLATLDDLTGISNRRGFMTLAQNALGICARQGLPVSLVFLDLNNFKQINDQFGHAEGDRALVAFSESMQNSFRESDLYGRLGGDEFIVLLSNTTDNATRRIIQRLGLSLIECNQKLNRGYDISFSHGIVTVNPEKNLRIDDLLNQADELMYKNKASLAIKKK